MSVPEKGKLFKKKQQEECEKTKKGMKRVRDRFENEKTKFS